MNAPESRPSRRSFSIRVFAVLGAIAFATAIVLGLRGAADPVQRIRLAGGSAQASRALILGSFAGELRRRGLEAEIVETGDGLDELHALRERPIDFALVSSAIELHRLHPDLREVAPFFEEALHLLVKRERLLKSGALARFSSGELGDHVQIGDLLVPLNAARDHVGSLLLHVRESLEAEARRQGRSAESVWEEAIEAEEGASARDGDV